MATPTTISITQLTVPVGLIYTVIIIISVAIFYVIKHYIKVNSTSKLSFRTKKSLDSHIIESTEKHEELLNQLKDTNKVFDQLMIKLENEKAMQGKHCEFKHALISNEHGHFKDTVLLAMQGFEATQKAQQDLLLKLDKTVDRLDTTIKLLNPNTKRLLDNSQGE